MDKDTAEGKAISEITFDRMDWAIIVNIWRDLVSEFATNINKICINMMRNTSFIGITSIFMNQFCNWGLPTRFSPVYYHGN